MMKKIRHHRLVCACINLLGGICRLAAAIVDMASNYHFYASKMDSQVRIKAGQVDLSSIA